MTLERKRMKREWKRIWVAAVLMTLFLVATGCGFSNIETIYGPEKTKKNGEVYHAAIIVELNIKKAFYAGHTTDRRHRDLSKAIDEGVIIVRMAVNAK